MKCEDCVHFNFDGVLTLTCFMEHGEHIGFDKEPCEDFDIGAEDGDIYLNRLFGDMWIVDNKQFIKINDGYAIDIDEPSGFVRVGHVDGVINKKRDD